MTVVKCNVASWKGLDAEVVSWSDCFLYTSQKGFLPFKIQCNDVKKSTALDIEVVKYNKSFSSISNFIYYKSEVKLNGFII